MKKEEIIPMWMFTHLRDQGNKERSNVVRDLNSKMQKINREIKSQLHWEVIAGKSINDCFYYDEYSGFKLKREYATKINDKFTSLYKLKTDQIREQIDDVNNQFKLWEESLLSGKIKRLDAKVFSYNVKKPKK